MGAALFLVRNYPQCRRELTGGVGNGSMKVTEYTPFFTSCAPYFCNPPRGNALLNSNSQVSFYVIILLSLLSLAGCGGGSGGGNFQQQTVVAISGTPPSAIGVGANWQYTATVNGVASQAVTWTISPKSAGTIDASTGLYIAPPAVPSPANVTITATSQADTSQSASASVTVQATDPLGKVSAVTTLPSCVGYSNWHLTPACYQMTVSCPGVADITTYLKVINPSGLPSGTVLFGVGTGGSGLYDDSQTYMYGYLVVENVVNAGFNTVEVSFGGPFTSSQPNGWLQGPGGVRRLACRYATVADWVYKNPTTINPNPNNTATNSAPMCATGNSGGSAAIAYGVYEYGLASEFKMIEPTSGPVMTRIDQGCSICGTITGLNACTNMQQDMCYSTGGTSGGDAAVIDEAYQSLGASTPTPCTDAINGTPAAAGLFLSDSILYQGSQAVSLANLTINQLFGESDTSNAVPQGTLWNQYITPTPGLLCLPMPVAHDIPSFSTGAQQIATDIENGCK